MDLAALLDGLNPHQHEAVTLEGRSALILAGAGSGKTRVLTTRIAFLVATHKASPHGILAVTFTNKAAREMLSRIAGMLPVNTRGMWVGTFHGLCNRLLRAHHREADLPSTFQILDSADQLAVVKRVIKAMGVDDEKFPPKQAQQFINSNKERGLRAPRVEAHDPFSQRMVEIYAAYDAQCRKEGVVDFAELLLRTCELLGADPALREHYQSRFAHLMVDEFQDTNRLQYQWLRLLTGPQAQVLAVGDDDQSIYAFRGADVGNMREFQRDFGDTVIRLEQNYRSQGNILEAANALIANNRSRLGKNLWTDAGAGERIRVYRAPSDLDEAAFVVEEARALQREGVPLDDVAVLYRSNAQSRVIESALFNAGMPYRVYGGLRFFERAEIKHALAYLRVAAQPEDDGAFLRIVNFPPRGIGARSLENLAESAHGRPLLQTARESAGAGRGGAALTSFVALVDVLSEKLRDLPLHEAVDHVIEVSGLKAHYKADKDGGDRVENLDELVSAAKQFAHEGEEDDLAAFLAHASLEAGEHQAGEGAEALQLMTVHAAKGLEFNAVFMTGLEEGLFPHEQSFNTEDGLEEERRLMYVAITRARRKLTLSYTESRQLHGQTRYNIPSRFLEEIPEQLLAPINARKMAVQRPSFSPAGVDNATGFHIGQNVRHAKFGAGVVIGTEGRGADARVQVHFREGGQKWLALEYAKLEPA
jgi:DNA helicase-2/ATP-dependent DNA helicase PcrA